MKLIVNTNSFVKNQYIIDSSQNEDSLAQWIFHVLNLFLNSVSLPYKQALWDGITPNDKNSVCEACNHFAIFQMQIDSVI